MQNPGTGLRIDTAAFWEELEHVPALRVLLLRYALVHHGQVARTAACNGRHHTEQRLARWLLMAHDRVEGDDYPMTHEFLGLMLGVRRAGITIAAGQLQKAGLIQYDRGRIEVTDRSGWKAPRANVMASAAEPTTACLGPSVSSAGLYRL